MSAHYFNPQEMINKTIIFDERPEGVSGIIIPCCLWH